MNLQFDSLAELTAFLDFAGYAKKTTSEITVDLKMSQTDIDTLLHTAAAQIDRQCVMSAADGSGGTGGVGLDAYVAQQLQPALETCVAAASSYADVESPIKRKRRTKAEIAADEAAIVAHPTHGEARTNAQTKPLDNLKSVAEAVLAHSVSAEGQAEFERAEVAASEAPAPVAPPSDIEHLRLCREFISSQGMNKYEHSFALAGIEGKNIMAFTDEDRTKHVAALAQLASAA